MIRVLLIDDHLVVRSGFRRLLAAEGDFEVVGEATCVEEANAVVESARPDVALVDLSLKGSSGLEAIQSILQRCPGLRVLVLSMHEGAGYVAQALKSGAHGYLTKHADPEDVIAALRRVAAGRGAFSPDIADALIDSVVDQDSPMKQLTPREFDVLRLIARGDSPSEIGRVMHLSSKTIYNYLSIIRQKLNADSNLKLLSFAMRHGLIDFDNTDKTFH